MEIRRGDIFLADFSEDSVDYVCKLRPVIIVQNNVGNAHSNSFLAAMITSRRKKKLPTHIFLSKKCGLKKASIVLCEHIVTVRRDMLRGYIGTIVNTEAEKKLDQALAVALQL